MTSKKLTLIFLFLVTLSKSYGQWEAIRDYDTYSSWDLDMMDSTLLWCGVTGIYLSNDAGATWQKASGNVVSSIAGSSGRILTGSPSGLFFSTDSGRTWTLDPQIGTTRIKVIKFLKDMFLVGTEGKGLYYSFDGSNWTNRYPKESIKDIDFKDDLYVLTESGLYKAQHPDSVWQLRNNTIQGNYYREKISVLNEKLYFTSFYNFSISYDSGTSWTRQDTRQENMITSVVSYKNDVIIGTYGTGFYISRKGSEEWFPFNLGISETSRTENDGSYFSIYNMTIGNGYLYGSTYKDNAIARRKVSDLDGIIYAGEGILLAPYNETASYRWYHNGHLLPEERSYKNVALSNGIYRVVIQNTKDGEMEQSTYNFEVKDLLITSVNTSSTDATLSVFPNPTKGDIIIKLKNNSFNKIQVVDLNGKVMVEENGSSKNNEQKLSLSSLNKGLYFIRVFTNDDSFIHKLMLE